VKCPICKDKDLEPVFTKQGVEVDFCPKCFGIWLDKDEIYHFTKVPSYLKAKIDEAVKVGKTSERISPVNGKPMLELAIMEGLHIDYCPDTEGIWLDRDEINKLPGIKVRIDIDDTMFGASAQSHSRILLPLPNLSVRSGMVLFGMYALLGLFLIALVEFGFIPSSFALLIGVVTVAIHFLLGPFLMDFSLKLFYKVRWIRQDELPVHLKNFISRVCTQKGIDFPRMGIIADGSPNAFTYGHHPNNARIVVTQGLLDLLSEKETEAVVAHEIGHAVHWDMLIMTLAQLVPLIMYYIYRNLIRMKSRGNDKSAPYRLAMALISYLLYIISEFVVLWFSRIREYFADRFSGEVTANPNDLASALVKIGYGLAGSDRSKSRITEEKRNVNINAIGPMGIFDSKTANILAIAGHSGARNMGQEVDKDKLRDAAKWDLWNPWAAYYELQSTHPLIAKRIKYLSNQSVVLGREPYIEFNERRPESYWDDFLLDIFVKGLPILALIAGMALIVLKVNYFYSGVAIFIVGIAYLINVFYSYSSTEFSPMTINSLLRKIKVSAIRPVPCKVKGKIIGRGIPGLIFSEDFVLQDDTGIIFLDYRQPLGIINFFFGLLRAAKYIDQEAEVVGWYRRAPVPFIEIKKLIVNGKESACYVYNAKLIFASLMIFCGIVIAFINVGG
jgi:heat shock protein HtpX